MSMMQFAKSASFWLYHQLASWLHSVPDVIAETSAVWFAATGKDLKIPHENKSSNLWV